MATTHRVDSGRAAPPPVSSEILDRLPPHNLEAEKAVLGSMLLDPNFCDDVALVVRPEDFYADAHRKLFAHMIAMRDEGQRIDVTLLTERLRQAGDFEAVGGAAGLAEVAQSVAVPAHAVYYGRIVRDKSTLRSLIHASSEILRDAYDPSQEPRELMSQAEEKIFAVHDQRSYDQVSGIHDVLIEAFQLIDRRVQGSPTGIPSGFMDLDRLTGGLHDSELVVLAARPSMGKSALATNIADHVSVNVGITTLLVSLEMSRLELAQRMLCAQGKINGNKFRNGYLSAADREKLVEASSRLDKARLFIDDTPSRTVTDIAACARRLKRREKLGLLVIDYLQLIEPDNPRDPRQEQVARIARRLKMMSRELDIPVLCLAQLNRQAEQSRDNKPRLNHLRESGAIEQDADVVMFVHREEYYQTTDEDKERVKGQAEIIVAKQRNGPIGDVKLLWQHDYTRFVNLEHRPYDEFEQFSSF